MKIKIVQNHELGQRSKEITHDPLLFSVAQRNILTVHRETLTQYITFKRGGRGKSVLFYSFATVTSCLDLSVRIVTKIPEGGASTYILHLSGLGLTPDATFVAAD